jgi:hypothetical protein
MDNGNISTQTRGTANIFSNFNFSELVEISEHDGSVWTWLAAVG